MTYTPGQVEAQAALERRDRGDVVTEAMLRAYATTLRQATRTDELSAYMAALPHQVKVSAEHEHIACASWPDLFEYHLGVSGEGKHAFNWSDKPHRLVYDLTHELSHLRNLVLAALSAQPAERRGEAKPFAWWNVVQPGGVAVQADCPAGWRGTAIPLYTHPAAPVDVPDGWVLVPREPTMEMVIAGRKRIFADMTGPNMGPSAKGAYEAMLAAAPPTPQEPQP